MDPAGELAQLVERGGELLARAASRTLGRRLGVGVDLRLREPERERERDEALLGAVVEVPLEAAPCLVAGLDDPCP